MQNIQMIYLFCMFYMDIQSLSCFRYWEIRRLGGLEEISKVSITPRLPTAKARRLCSIQTEIMVEFTGHEI